MKTVLNDLTFDTNIIGVSNATLKVNDMALSIIYGKGTLSGPNTFEISMWMDDDSGDLIAVSNLVGEKDDGHEVAGWIDEREINKIIDLMHNDPERIKRLKMNSSCTDHYIPL
tara:strand:+ start:225 stop:563 length:339 start_codon:yes stop_codon:yes gene_type:complete